MEGKTDIQVVYDNFPCNVPLARGCEEKIAQALYESYAPVPFDDLRKFCSSREHLYVVISNLRQKMQPGHTIESVKGEGYKLTYPNVCTDDGSVSKTRALLEERVQAFNERIAKINRQLQWLNKEKEELKKQLQIAEVGLLALDEMEVRR